MNSLKTKNYLSIAAGLLPVFFPLLVVVGYLILHPPDTSESAWDSFSYKQMASNPFISTTPPFGYRILSPLLVYLLPFSRPTGFIFLTVFSIVLGCVFTFFISRKVGLNRWESYAAIPLYLFHGGSLWLLNAPCHVDGLSTLLTSITIWALLVSYPGIAAPSIALNALNKESALFLLPVYWVGRWSRPRWKIRFLECLLISLPSVLIFYLIRYVWFSYTLQNLSTTGLQTTYEFFSFYSMEIKRLWSELGSTRLFTPTTYTFGMATLCGFVVMGISGSPRELRAGLLMLPPVIIQLFFATGDLRLKHLALPILIPFALRGITDRFEGNRMRVIALTTLCIVYLVLPDNTILCFVLPMLCYGIKKVSSIYGFKL